MRVLVLPGLPPSPHANLYPPPGRYMRRGGSKRHMPVQDQAHVGVDKVLPGWSSGPGS